MFASVTVFSIIFVNIFVPGTFGKSFEEIEEHYQKICYSSDFKNAKSNND